MLLNLGAQPYEHSSAAACASGAATALQQKRINIAPPYNSTPQPNQVQPASRCIVHPQPSPCNSSNAGGAENSSLAAQAEQKSSHATSVSGRWDHRVHRVDRHRVNAYYPLVGLELGGALELRSMRRVVLCSVCGFCCAACARYLVGEKLWSIISSPH